MKSDVMKYKNYYGSVHYSDEDKVLYGRLEGIRDLVSYEGEDVLTLRESFEEAVEDYLATCKEEGRTPETPFKGSFNVRVSPEVHRQAAIIAANKGISLNKYVSEVLEKDADNMCFSKQVKAISISARGRTKTTAKKNIIGKTVRTKKESKSTIHK